MNLKDKIGEATNRCATSKGLIEGVSYYVTEKGAIKKELSKKDKEFAHVYVKNGKLSVDYAKKEEKPGKSTGTKKATRSASNVQDTTDAKSD